MTTKITSANLDATTIGDPRTNEFNTSLLGFKIAVNEGLTIFLGFVLYALTRHVTL